MQEALERIQFLCCNSGGQCESDPMAVFAEIHEIASAALPTSEEAGA